MKSQHAHHNWRPPGYMHTGDAMVPKSSVETGLGVGSETPLLSSAPRCLVSRPGFVQFTPT